ncbi:MAG: thiamine phosphate synthase [Chloroflexus sp.]
MVWQGTITWDLYVITDAGLARGRSHQTVLEAAIAGGATVVQYREKAASTRQMVTEARELRELAQRAGVPLIVNDRIDVALAVDADGVHIGQDDMPVRLARQLIGPDKILGVSVSTLDEARQAVADGADYLGVGPIFATPTKPDAAPPIGMDGLRQICQHISIPIVAIGGINATNAAEAIAAGADGVAVVSAIVAATDVTEAARQLRAIVTNARRATAEQRGLL